MTKEFKGSWIIFFFLLCLGIVPAIIYFAIMYKEVEPIQQQQQQTVIIQQPTYIPPTPQKYCPQCGTAITGNFCQNCGYKVE